MIALIDADILPYELGSVFDESVDAGTVVNAVDNKIESIVKGAECNDYICFLTESKTNFRIQRATVAPYKGHRPSDKPFWWDVIRSYIIHEYDPHMCIGFEADDYIADHCRKDIEGTVICSRDKDLDTVPGWHYRWQCGERQPERKYYVNDHEAEYFFYYQLLTGDVADNIKGCYGVGAKKAEKILKAAAPDYLSAVYKTYLDVYGQEAVYYEDISKKRYWRTAKELMAENADLLYIGTDRNYLERFK